MKIDEQTISIIKHLRDGRKSFREIAVDLGVSENTIRARVTRLQDEGVLEVSGLVDPACLPGHTVVIIGIKLLTMDLVGKGLEFAKLKGVVASNVVTGRYDLLVTVLLSPDFGLLEFYTQEVSKVKDVLSSETFVVYKGYNLKVPYVL